MSDDTINNKVLWIIAGAAIGATLALVFAPVSGEETRATLAKKTEKSRASVAESVKEVLEQGREMFERGRQLADEAGDMFERGRKIVESTAAHLQQAEDAQRRG